jgi:hypothetical protein
MVESGRYWQQKKQIRIFWFENITSGNPGRHPETAAQEISKPELHLCTANLSRHEFLIRLRRKFYFTSGMPPLHRQLGRLRYAQGCQMFLATTYQNGKHIPNHCKINQIATRYVYQMAIK